MFRICAVIVSLATTALLVACQTLNVPSVSSVTDIPVTEAPAAVTEAAQAIVAAPAEPVYYAGEIDVRDIIDKMHRLVKYVHSPAQEGFERMDLLYFLFETAMFDAPNSRPRYVHYVDEGNASGFYVASAGALADYLEVYFDISADYLDKYKNADYVFQSEHSEYIAGVDAFRFRQSDLRLFNLDERYTFSEAGAEIIIDGSDIAVRTVVSSPEGRKSSLEYRFAALEFNGEAVYRLLSVETIPIPLENEVVFTIDGVDYYAPWYTIRRDGQIEFSLDAPVLDFGYESWSAPYAKPELNNGKQGEHDGIYRCVIYRGIAYIGAAYKGIGDTFVYDMEGRTGCWMSGGGGGGGCGPLL
jgi:hypothetical protein